MGFNLEFFPGWLLGKPWLMDDRSGIFPQQPDGPLEVRESYLKYPGDFAQPLKLYDGRLNHNNGWFVLRSEIAPGATEGAVRWHIDPSVVEDWIYQPVIQTSQVGYAPSQEADDRWVFTENNPMRELSTATDLAVAYRSLKGYNDTLANHCLQISKELFGKTRMPAYSDPRWAAMADGARIPLAVELFFSTGEQQYFDFVLERWDLVVRSVAYNGCQTARFAKPLDGKKKYAGQVKAYREALLEYRKTLSKMIGETPYGVPYRPDIWGAGWTIWSEPCRLVLHPRRRRFRNGTYPSGLSRTSHLAIPLAAGRIRPRRRLLTLYVPGSGHTETHCISIFRTLIHSEVPL